MNKKYAHIYLKKGKFFFHPESITDKNAIVFSEPIIIKEESDLPEAIAQALLDCLDNSKIGIKHPNDWDNLLNPLLEIAETKSYAEFITEAKFVSVILDSDNLMLVPFCYLKDKKKYVSMRDNVTLINMNKIDLKQLGAYIYRCFEIAK